MTLGGLIAEVDETLGFKVGSAIGSGLVRDVVEGIQLQNCSQDRQSADPRVKHADGKLLGPARVTVKGHRQELRLTMLDNFGQRTCFLLDPSIFGSGTRGKECHAGHQHQQCRQKPLHERPSTRHVKM